MNWECRLPPVTRPRFYPSLKGPPFLFLAFRGKVCRIVHVDLSITVHLFLYARAGVQWRLDTRSPRVSAVFFGFIVDCFEGPVR